MFISAEQTLDIVEALENFLDRKRPPIEIRSRVDIEYEINGKSVIIYEKRPRWNKPGESLQIPIAKTTYVITKRIWKVYWQRADLKWHPYSPATAVKSIKDFIRLVEKDDNHCFWG